jgi:hypothetical protein
MPLFSTSATSGNATALQGRAVSASVPPTGSVLAWDGAAWGPQSGTTGATGPAGWDGQRILRCSGAPDSVLGRSGDYALTTSGVLYGPKASGDWGAGMQLQSGPAGPTGPAGPASTVTGPAGPASSVPGPTGPASTVPGPTGPAGSVGPASTVTGPTGPAGSFADAGGKRVITGSYTLVAADAGRIVVASGASGVAIRLTVPADADVAFADTVHVDLARLGSATVLVTGATGVTIRGVGTQLRDLHSAASLVKLSVNEWLVAGDVA